MCVCVFLCFLLSFFFRSLVRMFVVCVSVSVCGWLAGWLAVYARVCVYVFARHSLIEGQLDQNYKYLNSSQIYFSKQWISVH